MHTDANVKPLTAVAVIAFFVALLGARFWAYGESVSVPGFSYLHRHPSGDTVVLFNYTLYRFNTANELHSRTDLAHFGVPRGQVTDFAWFSNGDLLLRAGRRSEDLLFNVNRFLRKTNQTPELTHYPAGTLVRCKPDTGNCRPFSASFLNLNDVFALEIDTRNDRVFIADSSRHKIYLLSSQGRELDRISEGLTFPNQLSFIGDRLYVANTNRHVISVYRVTNNRFADGPEKLEIVPAEAATAGQTWPAALLISDDMLWVINATTGMDHGGIYQFDISEESRYVKRLVMDEEADPVAMVRHGDRILVSDLSHDRIDTFDLDGQPAGELLPGWLRGDVMAVRAERKSYQQLTHVLSGLFIASLLAGFAYAAYRQFGRSTAGTDRDAAASVLPIDIHDPHIVWIEADRKARRTLYVLPLVMLLLPLLTLVARSQPDKTAIVVDTAAMIALPAFALVLFVAIYLGLKMRIGVLGDRLILANFKGHYSSGTGAEIRYSDKVIMVGDQFAILGAQPAFFPTEQLVRHVYPLLQTAEYVPPGKMQWILMQRSKPARYVFFVLMAGLLGTLIYLLR